METCQPETISQEKFLTTLSASLHQMAQPMATIQASLELALLSPTTEAEYKEIAENILGQLKSAVESMQFAGRLARYQQPAKDVREILLSVALDEAISSLQRTFDTAQLQLLFFRSEREQPICISPVRLRQMLFYVLQAVQGCSQPGDLAKIEIQDPAGRMVLRIKHSCNSSGASRTSSTTDAKVERALALAEAIVTGAGGDFMVSTGPLLIVADFPVKHESKSAAIDKSKPSEFKSVPLAFEEQRSFKMS